MPLCVCSSVLTAVLFPPSLLFFPFFFSRQSFSMVAIRVAAAAVAAAAAPPRLRGRVALKRLSGCRNSTSSGPCLCKHTKQSLSCSLSLYISLSLSFYFSVALFISLPLSTALYLSMSLSLSLCLCAYRFVHLSLSLFLSDFFLCTELDYAVVGVGTGYQVHGIVLARKHLSGCGRMT